MPAKKPTSLKVYEGQRGHRTKDELAKQRNEPKPRPITPDIPSFLDDTGRERWNELVDELQMVGVLTVVDGDILGAYCDAFSRLKRADKELDSGGWTHVVEKSGYSTPSPWVAIRNRALDDLRRFGAELGIGAAARSKVEVKKKDAAKSPLEAVREKTRRRG